MRQEVQAWDKFVGTWGEERRILFFTFLSHSGERVIQMKLNLWVWEILCCRTVRWRYGMLAMTIWGWVVGFLGKFLKESWSWVI